MCEHRHDYGCRGSEFAWFVRHRNILNAQDVSRYESAVRVFGAPRCENLTPSRRVEHALCYAPRMRPTRFWISSSNFAGESFKGSNCFVIFANAFADSSHDISLRR